MPREILKIHNETPEIRKINKVADVIRDGGVILYPSDTAYALGCNLSDKNAIEKVRRLKGIGKSQSLTFICSSLDNISEFANVSNNAFKTIKRLIPGPFTFILPASNLVPKFAQNPKRKTAGIRVPDNIFTQLLVKELNHPMISISAPEDDFENVMNQVDIMIEMEENNFVGESTIIDMSSNEFEVIREGAGIDQVNELSF